jgi:hypothetical protein
MAFWRRKQPLSISAAAVLVVVMLLLLLLLLMLLLVHFLPTRSEPQLPIAFLRVHNVSVRARLTSAAAAAVNLSFAFTDPELDWDVSKHVQQDGILEIGISQVRLMRKQSNV